VSAGYAHVCDSASFLDVGSLLWVTESPIEQSAVLAQFQILV